MTFSYLYPLPGKNILLVIGGMTSDGPTPEVEAIHLGGEGMVCDAPASLPYPNSKMSAAEINGDPVVCGGDDFSGQMCFRLHAEDGDGADPAWGPIASMRMARYGHASAQMTSDTFWMTGGIVTFALSIDGNSAEHLII